MGIEQLVRPFQSPGVLVSRRVVPVREDVQVTSAGKRWGQAGPMPVAQPATVGGIAFEVRNLNNAQEVRTERRFTDVRIENPDDPDQYVIVRRTDGMRLNYIKPRTLASYPEPGMSQPASDPSPPSGVKPFAGPAEYFVGGAPTEVPISGAPTMPLKITGIKLSFDNSGEPGTPVP